MSSTRICDHCGKEIALESEAVSDNESGFKCPSCGNTMKARHDETTRVEKITTLFFDYNGKRKEAVLMDISNTGAKILYIGRPLPVNARIEVDIQELKMLNRLAEVVWSKKSDGPFSHAGIRFI